MLQKGGGEGKSVNLVEIRKKLSVCWNKTWLVIYENVRKEYSWFTWQLYIHFRLNATN